MASTIWRLGGHTSWHGYARHVIEWARERGQPLKLPADRLLPIPSSAYPTPARRPLNSRLDTRRLQQTFGLQLPDWRAAWDRMLTENSSGLTRPPPKAPMSTTRKGIIPGRRLRHPAAPGHAGHQQAADPRPTTSR